MPIPKSFYVTKQIPVIDTVGELIDHLQQIPQETIIRQDYCEAGVKVVYFGIDEENGHLAFEEIN